MPDLLITGLDEKIVALLEERAAARGRTLEEEARHILEDALERGRRERFSRWAGEFSRSLEGRVLSDSADLIREDRDTDHGRDW